MIAHACAPDNNTTHLFSLLLVNKFKRVKHMVNASSCTVELWMHLRDVWSWKDSQAHENSRYSL